MKFTDAKKRVEFLKNQLNQWNYEYYVQSNPSVNDQEYDRALQELILLEQEYSKLISFDSPTQKVSGEISKKNNKFEHIIPMLSLGNVFNLNDLYRFDKQIKELTGLNKISYTCELKIDGLSISLIYENYILKVAATRGNGQIGENVTANIKKIKSVPLKIKQKKLIVRGEVYLSINDFNKINQEKKNNDEIEFANPRNAAAGTLRQLNSSIIIKRNLNVFLYYYVNAIKDGIKTQNESLKELEKLQFKINHEYRLCHNIEEVWKYIEEYQNKRHNLDYEIDGIVIKVDDFSLYNKIGYTTKNPKWAIAYKFPSEIAITKILDIFPTVGRTGRITYNAKLEPVRIAGTIVKAATLHNANFLNKKNIRIGDFVNVKKAGDIIPKVINYLPERRDKKSKKWKESNICPICHTLLKRINNEIDQYCVNLLCNKKITRLLEHYCSRNAMNIEGVSEKIIKNLFKLKYLKCFSDLYKLEKYRTEIIKLNNFGKKSFNKIIISINDSKKNSLEKLLFGLGIRHVGQKTAKLIARKFKTLDNLQNTSFNELISINDIGPIIAESIINYFKIKNNIQEIKNLLKLGVNQNYIVYNNEFFFNKLKGCFFVITGVLSKPREYFKNLIESFDGIVLDSVSSKTTYVLSGINAGIKLVKAQKLNVKIINEEEFNQLIKGE